MASIYRRKNTWWITYYVNAKKIHRSLKTKEHKVAKLLKSKIEVDLSRGKLAFPPSDRTPLQIYDEYLEYCKPNISKSTYFSYKHYIKDFIESSKIGRMNQITPLQISRYLTGCSGLSENTRKHLVDYIRTFVRFAVSHNYIPENPLKNLRIKKPTVVPPRYLTKPEITSVIDASVKAGIYPMVMTAIYSGARLSELRRLRWSNIDFERRIITIEKSKSGRFREIPLHRKLADVLRPLASDGLCFNKKNMRRRFDQMKIFAKIDDIGWHTFRHTFASLLAQAGVSLYKISKYLGHSSIKTTEIYAHLIPENSDIDSIDL